MGDVNQLAQLRESKGYTMAGLAREIGVYRQALHKWERGEYAPKPDAVQRMADALAVTTDEVYAALNMIPPDVLGLLHAGAPESFEKVREVLK